MAKRASSKPQDKPAKSAPAAPAVTTPLSTAESGTPLVDSPAEGSGGASPQVSLSEAEGVQQDAAGNTYAEGDLGAEADILADEPGLVSTVEPTVEPAAELSEPIKQAQSYITPHGVPHEAHHQYYTPPPPDLRPRNKAL